MSAPYRLADPTLPAPLAMAATRPTPMRRKVRRLHRRAGLSSSFWLTGVCGVVLLTVINGAGHGPLWFAAVFSAQAAALITFPTWRGSQQLRERMLRHARGVQRERMRRALPPGVRELLDSPSLIDQEVALNMLGSSIDPSDRCDDAALRADYIAHMKDGRIVKLKSTRTTTFTRAVVVLPLGDPNGRVSK